MYGAELILFRGWQAVKNGAFYNNYLNNGALSVYYECTDLSNASVYFDDGAQHTNISLRKITSGAFIQNTGKKHIGDLNFLSVSNSLNSKTILPDLRWDCAKYAKRGKIKPKPFL